MSSLVRTGVDDGLIWYSFYTTIRFEFDAAKSAANKVKHVTERHDETIRIISVRRARRNERARYLAGC